MVTSGFEQYKGTVTLRDNVTIDEAMEKEYFSPSWEFVNCKKACKRKSSGFISFGTRYLSFRNKLGNKASEIPYSRIKMIELNDERGSITNELNKSKKKNKSTHYSDVYSIKSKIILKEPQYFNFEHLSEIEGAITLTYGYLIIEVSSKEGNLPKKYHIFYNNISKIELNEILENVTVQTRQRKMEEARRQLIVAEEELEYISRFLKKHHTKYR